MNQNEQECAHEWERVPRLYVDGLPLYRCTLCDLHSAPDTEPSHQALAPIAPKERP